jgi:hypothetical protein
MAINWKAIKKAEQEARKQAERILRMIEAAKKPNS